MGKNCRQKNQEKMIVCKVKNSFTVAQDDQSINQLFLTLFYFSCIVSTGAPTVGTSIHRNRTASSGNPLSPTQEEVYIFYFVLFTKKQNEGKSIQWADITTINTITTQEKREEEVIQLVHHAVPL